MGQVQVGGCADKSCVSCRDELACLQRRGDDSTRSTSDTRASSSEREMPQYPPEDETAFDTSGACGYFESDIKEIRLLRSAPSEEQPLEGQPFTFASGATYTGQWSRGARHGFGKQRWPDGTVYEGEWRDNAACGRGRLSHHDGDVYIGQWADSVAHGLGTYYHRGTASFRGQWRQDLPDGYGIELDTAWSGDGNSAASLPEYRGLFKQKRKHGAGCYQRPDSSVLLGQWIDNTLDGYGAFYAPDGRCFKGQWCRSTFHGIGRYVWAGGREYSGAYVSNLKQGFGIFKWPDGRQYEGFWEKGQQDFKNGMGRQARPQLADDVNQKHRDVAAGVLGDIIAAASALDGVSEDGTVTMTPDAQPHLDAKALEDIWAKQPALSADMHSQCS